MDIINRNITPVVAAILLFLSVFAVPTGVLAQSDAQAEELDALFQQLKMPVDGDWKSVEQRIWAVWSESGSDAMNLLLRRGRQAVKAKDYNTAIEHFSALIDHAPKFAAGWNARATAWFKMGEYGLAVGDIQHVLTLEPRHFGALSGLGLIFEKTGQPRDALKAYKAALAIHPFRPDIIDAIKRVEQMIGGASL